VPKPTIIEQGKFSFTVESRILRELGERLVKQPDVAVLELIKNAYDADASLCTIEYEPGEFLKVTDNGLGITLERFRDAWMRIGTSAKEKIAVSPRYQRQITGEKGIGRFSVRFLGRALQLESVAYDRKRKMHTRLVADFDWPKFDQHEDLGKVAVPFRLEAASSDTPLGTVLTITELRPEAERLDLRRVRTGSLGILSPLKSLFVRDKLESDAGRRSSKEDPGFQLTIQFGADQENEEDVGATILDNFVLRAELRLDRQRVTLAVFKRGNEKPYLKVVDTFKNDIQNLEADIRFFPYRTGTFTGIGVDGRVARSWISNNSGVAIFDRNFRVLPYGTPSDDWLKIQADSVRSERNPRSPLSLKHFPMSPKEKTDTKQNWMLRLPEAHQLVGIVQVEGRRTASSARDDKGLVASADREGFVENETFKQLFQLVRGAVEALAFADRKIQLEELERDRKATLATLRRETRSAISEVQANPNIAATDKARIVSALAETQQLAEHHAESSREREQQLEVMSLLGVVAGFMTHEFGVALKELEDAQKELIVLAKTYPRLQDSVAKFEVHIKSLRDFVTYSSGYIQGAKLKPDKPYPVRPRLNQVKRVFGRYAEERNIAVEINAETDLLAPKVPASLYNGIALNLYTNALKAVVAKTGKVPGAIAFRAWNDDRWHNLEVSDNGIGIPSALSERIFDPLFTTTDTNRDPLGSGMGLGLALVRRGAEAFGGKADIVDPPPGFATCVRVRIPLE
jgi:signal transduction histidine kinase